MRDVSRLKYIFIGTQASFYPKMEQDSDVERSSPRTKSDVKDEKMSSLPQDQTDQKTACPDSTKLNMQEATDWLKHSFRIQDAACEAMRRLRDEPIDAEAKAIVAWKKKN